MINERAKGFAMRQPAEFVRWWRGREGWESETIAGIPTGWSPKGLYLRVDGRTVVLDRDEWSYCDSSS